MDKHLTIARRLLDLLFGPRDSWEFLVRLWDGSVLGAAERPRFTLVVNGPGSLRAAFTPPIDFNPGRAFVEGLLDVEGDPEALIDTMMQAVEGMTRRTSATIALLLLRLPSVAGDNGSHQAHLRGRRHSRKRDSAAIGFHYDQPVGFYRTFLGEDLVYSCAYYDEGVETLDEAQRAKIDYTLSKLRLRPGETLLDIGCGWGGLVMRAAQKFGVKALGITLSRRQFEEAQRRISAANLEGKAVVELCDYRDLGGRTFDKIVSVGMVEHVGRSRLRTYFESALRALRPGGLFLNHGIAEQTPQRRGYKVSGFIGRYVFPDGELFGIWEMLAFAERLGFEIRDVENLREHYARTLRDWVANLERNRDAAIGATDERTYRIWRLYMAGSAQGFNRGRMALFQSLLGRADARGHISTPMTRRDLYAGPNHGARLETAAPPPNVRP